MNIDQFKCLMFICGLKGHNHADIRARLLARIESEPPETPTTLQQLIDEYQPHSSGRHQQFSTPDHKSPRTPCWQCGQMHYVRDCPFSNHRCKQCNRVGHKEGYC
uniref:CCHC-type domain-containing protein n=1 Tax=Anopheles epiroticus TaxID=199890 RepID=A0A182PXA1_9DIPT